MENKSNIAENTDIEALKKVMNRDIVLEPEINKLTIGASCYGPIYPETNEYISLYYEKDLKDKKVLSVTASGDHILHAVLAGATNITGFDVNRFTKYYSSLRVAMVKSYDDIKFLSNHQLFFNSIKALPKLAKFDDTLYRSCLNNIIHILSDISSNLTSEEKLFWNEYIKIATKTYVSRHLFVDIDNESCLVNKLAYLEPSKYEILKSNLNEANIKYIDSNVNQLDKIVTENYDFIYLSNIIERILLKDVYFSSPSEESVDESIDLLIYLSNILNKGGIISDLSFRYYISTWDSRRLKKVYEILESKDDKGQHTYRYIKK